MSLQLVGETLTTEKTGAATATVSFYEADDLPVVPTKHRGLKLTKRDTRQQEDGGFITMATYEGRNQDVVAGGGGGSTSQSSADETVYEWSPTFEQTDIAKNPNIQTLLDEYDGEQDTAGNIIWPPTLNQQSAAAGGLSQGEQQSQTINPMYGVTEFLSLGGIWSETSLKPDLPDDVFTAIGNIVEAPPGPIPTPPNRFWLTMPPIVAEHGDQWKVTRRWMLSGVASSRDVEAAKKIYEQQA